MRFGTELTIGLHPGPEAEPLPTFTSFVIDRLTWTEHSNAARGRSFRSNTDGGD